VECDPSVTVKFGEEFVTPWTKGKDLGMAVMKARQGAMEAHATPTWWAGLSCKAIRQSCTKIVRGIAVTGVRRWAMVAAAVAVLVCGQAMAGEKYALLAGCVEYDNGPKPEA